MGMTFRYDQARLKEVEDARQNSGKLSALKRQLRELFAGRRCLVVGSAPNPVGPVLANIDATVCINGSGWAARKMGVICPELTVISSRVTRPDQAVRAATMSVLNGLQTRHLMLIDVDNETDRACKALDAAGLTYENLLLVGPLERAAIVGAVCGAELGWGASRDRISNGVFAITLPVWAGAREVVLAGFSLEGGHSYISHGTKRGHLSADTSFFRIAATLPSRVSTTSHELHDAFAISMAI
jgi:hypothetical protein